MADKKQSAEKKQSAVSDQQSAQDKKTERVRSPRVNAGSCPTSENHQNTVVYRTKGRTRYCKCNDCGATWKLSGEYADPLKEYCAALAESFDKAPRVKSPQGDQVILLEDKDTKQIAKKLRELIKD